MALRARYIPQHRTNGQLPADGLWATSVNCVAFPAPADFTFGNAGKTAGFGPGAIAMDLSLIRDFPMTEHHQIEFGLESLNFINNPTFANPNVSRGNAAFGRITALAPGNQARINQLGLRYSF